ncbi:MAG: cytochrome-c peroxidase [Proteobacteria bacterium]|nr:cytochrome-c peroxidase [Pseudomonadota bacterium]MBU1737375.1 cytochrome-c peroxidase [Pseudomonadota bacterium]
MLAGCIFIAAGAATAGESSVEKGSKLFNDPALGGSTNPKSCNSCHPGGEGLEKAGAKANLTEMINRCVVGPLKGSKIDGRSVEMRSLKMYIESLSGK